MPTSRSSRSAASIELARRRARSRRPCSASCSPATGCPRAWDQAGTRRPRWPTSSASSSGSPRGSGVGRLERARQRAMGPGVEHPGRVARPAQRSTADLVIGRVGELDPRYRRGCRRPRRARGLRAARARCARRRHADRTAPGRRSHGVAGGGARHRGRRRRCDAGRRSSRRSSARPPGRLLARRHALRSLPGRAAGRRRGQPRLPAALPGRPDADRRGDRVAADAVVAA